MAFKKGQSGNKEGRPKGTPNVLTKDARDAFIKIMEGEVDNVQYALEEIRNTSSFNYIMCLSKLMPYFMPKMIDVTSNGEGIAPMIIDWTGNKDTTDSKAD